MVHHPFVFAPLWFLYFAFMTNHMAQDVQPIGELVPGRRDREGHRSLESIFCPLSSLCYPYHRESSTVQNPLCSEQAVLATESLRGVFRYFGNKLRPGLPSCISRWSCVHLTSVASILSRCPTASIPSDSCE